MRTFNVRQYNDEIIMLEEKLDSLNKSLEELKKWINFEITDEFLEKLALKPEVILDRYLSYKHISKEMFNSYNIKLNDCDNPLYEECEEGIIELVSIARVVKANLYNLLDFICCELGNTFTMKDGVASMTDTAEYNIMRGCCTFTKDENERQFLTCSQNICDRIKELKNYGIPMSSLKSIADNN